MERNEEKERERKGGREFVTGITTGPRAEAHARAKRAREEIRPTLPSLETGAETATSAKPILECRTIDSGRPASKPLSYCGKIRGSRFVDIPPAFYPPALN